MADEQSFSRADIAAARITTRMTTLVNERETFQEQTQQQIDLEQQAIAKDREALVAREQRLQAFVLHGRLSLAGFNAAIGELTALMEPDASPEQPRVADAPVFDPADALPLVPMEESSHADH